MTEEMNMDALLAGVSPVSEGGIVTARVVEVREGGVLVDVGMKAESFIPLEEFGPGATVRVGDQIPVFVKKGSTAGEQIQVSWKRAHEMLGWEKVLKAFSVQTPLSGTVVRKIKGGVVVDLGVPAFLPASQVDSRTPRDLGAWVGREVQVVVIECNQKKGSVVLSRRRLLEQERALNKEALLKDLAAGQVRHGRVTGIASFGAFIDIGGLEGLLHISDMDWRQPARPDAVLKVGDELKVQVLKFDPATHRLSLGRKQLMPHPWDGLEERLKPGQTIQGKVSSLATFGAFVEIEPGVEGLIHLSELSWTQRPRHAKEVLKLGQTVDVKVLLVSRADEKLSLSFKRMEPSPWEEAARRYPSGTRLKAEVSRLTSQGAFLKLPASLVEGFLKVQDISWTKRVRSPGDILKVGETVEAIVLEAIPQQEKIVLGLKQFSPDPLTRLKVGQVVTGKVVRVIDAGVFIEMESGLEAFVRKSETEDPREHTAPRNLSEGEGVVGVIVKIEKRERKIDVSIKRHEQAEQRALMKKYTRPSSGPTLGDVMDWKNNSE